MIEVQLGAAIDDALHRRGIELPKRAGVLLDFLEERAVPDQRDFDRLDMTPGDLNKDCGN